MDPLTKDYADLTPYQYSSNNPIYNIDVDGLEGTDFMVKLIYKLVGKVDEQADKIKQKEVKTKADNVALFLHGVIKSTPFGVAYQTEKSLKQLAQEAKGWMNQYDFGERVYDPRIGRWLSIDPLKQKFANLTPYNSMNNNPVLFMDPDGRTIIIDARSLMALLQTLDHLAILQMTNDGSKTIQRLHETSALYKINAYGIDISEFTGSDNTIKYNPFSSINYNKGYKEHPLLSLGHELDHAAQDLRGSRWSKGVLEASAVNPENYYRSVIFGEKSYENEYDWGWGDADKYDDEFKWNVAGDPNPNGERVFRSKQEIRGDIKVDSKNTYVIETVGTFDADSEKVKNFKNGIVNYFWYKKDKDSEWEHKAVLIKVVNANEEKKD